MVRPPLLSSIVVRSTSSALLAILALISLLFALLALAPAVAAQGGVTVTPSNKLEGCEGVRETPGSANTSMTVVGGDRLPGGNVVIRMSFPFDANSDGGDSFSVDDCMFLGNEAVRRWTIDAPNNSQENNGYIVFEVTLDLPQDEPGTEYCNHGRHTGTPPSSPASNRKASVCFQLAQAQAPGAAPSTAASPLPSERPNTALESVGAGPMGLPAAALFVTMAVRPLGALAYGSVRGRR